MVPELGIQIPELTLFFSPPCLGTVRATSQLHYVYLFSKNFLKCYIWSLNSRLLISHWLEVFNTDISHTSITI